MTVVTVDAAAAAADDEPDPALLDLRSRGKVVWVPPLMVPVVAVCPKVSTSWHCPSC